MLSSHGIPATGKVFLGRVDDAYAFIGITSTLELKICR
jgi:hypothetical protein